VFKVGSSSDRDCSDCGCGSSCVLAGRVPNACQTHVKHNIVSMMRVATRRCQRDFVHVRECRAEEKLIMGAHVIKIRSWLQEKRETVFVMKKTGL
jgi:hypothetical protein